MDSDVQTGTNHPLSAKNQKTHAMVNNSSNSESRQPTSPSHQLKTAKKIEEETDKEFFGTNQSDPLLDNKEGA